MADLQVALQVSHANLDTASLPCGVEYVRLSTAENGFSKVHVLLGLKGPTSIW